MNAKKARSGNPAKRHAAARTTAESNSKLIEFSLFTPSKFRGINWSKWQLEWLLIAVSAVLSYFYLVERLKGVSVSVLQDEYVYVLDAHYRELSDAHYPNHLFQAIYQATNSCGIEFYECARSLNTIFVLLSAIFIYLIALHISNNKWLSLIAYLVTIFSTFGTYTAYFMPEALFNFLMLLSFYLLIRFGNSSSWAPLLVIGLSFGIASLAKPHTLFVLPAISVFLFFWSKSDRNVTLLKSLARPIVVMTTVLVSKLALGFLLAGENGFSLFGSYGNPITSNDFLAIFELIRENISGLIILFGLGSLVVYLVRKSNLKSKLSFFSIKPIRLFTILTIGAILIIGLVGVSSLSSLDLRKDFSVASVLGSPAVTLLTNWLQALLGQTIMVLLVLGLSIPISILSVMKMFRLEQYEFNITKLRILFGLSLLNMVIVVSVFEAWQNLTLWMHTRYYTYLIPIALVALIEAYAHPDLINKKIVRIAMLTFLLSLVSILLFITRLPYSGNWIDAPDFLFYASTWDVSILLVLITIVIAIWSLWNYRRAVVAAIIATGIALIMAGNFVNQYLETNFGKVFAADQLGKILRDYLPQQDLNRTVFVGANLTDMERALFFARTGSDFIKLAPESGISISDLNRNPRWLVQLGEIDITGLSAPILTGDGFTLHSLTEYSEIRPRNNQIVSFSNPCTLGENSNWSCGNETTIDLNTTITGRADAYLIFEVPADLAGQEFTFVAGDSSLNGTLPSGLVAVAIPFENTVPVNQVTIKLAKSNKGIDLNEIRFIRPISINLYPNIRN